MEIATTLSNTIDASETKARYDAACKKILAEKIILAWIMKNTMKEYSSKTVQEIVDRYIVGTPEIATVPVAPDTTNTAKASTVAGTGVEDTSCTEGKVTFDIRFQAVLPDVAEIVGLIINVEAQNNYNPGYPLLKRGIYYCSRLISSQYGPVFLKSEYDKIKKVYSVWICLDPPEERKNTITRYSISEDNLVGDVKECVEYYDLISVIMVCLGKDDADKTGKSTDNSLLKLLDVLLSNQTDAKTKKEILEKDFNIPMTEQLERGMDEMCNLSDGVWEAGVKQGREESILSSLDKLMANMHLSAEQAMDALEISIEDRAKYSAMLTK